MATQGESAWNKYYTGKNVVETIVKESGTLYDPDTPYKALPEKILIGEKIKVIVENTYKPKLLIIYKDRQYRYPLSKIAKPATKETHKLKPFDFQIESHIWYENYVRFIRQKIYENKYDPALALYLSSLIDFYTKNTNKSDLTRIYTENKDTLPISQIIKDFGEVLGPIACIDGRIDKRVDRNSRVYFPRKQNEAHYDFMLVNQSREFEYVMFSNKSGVKTSNVVKPSIILSLLSLDAATKARYESTLEYKVLADLDEGTTIGGPIRAAATIVEKLPWQKALFGDVTREMAIELETMGNEYSLNLLSPILEKIPELKGQGKIPASAISYHFQRALMKFSKTSLNFKPIFIDAIGNKISYLKFSINSDGTPNMVLQGPQEFEYATLHLRSKNGWNFSSDKMGIQT